jgi:hypothetical protein
VTTFKLGDRVTRPDRPDERGTVEAVITESAYGVLYEVKWDAHARGQFDGDALVAVGHFQRG